MHPSSEMSLYMCICLIYDNKVMALPLVVPHLTLYSYLSAAWSSQNNKETKAKCDSVQI